MILLLHKKRQNYSQPFNIRVSEKQKQLISNLVDQKKIKNDEFGQYNDQSVHNFQGIVDNQNDNNEFIQSKIYFLKQELSEFIQLKQLFNEADYQIQMKTFPLLLDLYYILIIKKPGEEEQQYWFGDY
ncbi:unnamed protein product [Paramecium sonneborni]|uniref:Uncharacterized protein n=1 Tax=Paramecium sonneborni TaxID=65129 RepID=A0A8S1L1Y7_9CILI|nr:unnamed protein product [Paramecium sonneborni]